MAAAPQNPNQAIDMMTPITVTHVILMILLALAALAAIWWGAVLSRRRRAAQKQVDEDFQIAREHHATTEPTATIDAPATLSEDVPAEGVPAEDVPPEDVPENETPDIPTPGATPVASDLNQIKGLGPKLAATLAELGVTRVEQIAALTPQAAADLDAKLGTFRGRIARDRWIEQAKRLTAGDRAGYEAAFGKLGG